MRDRFPNRLFSGKETNQRMAKDAYHCLNPVPFEIDADQLLRLLRIKRPDDPGKGRLLELAGMAQEIARPKALYKICRIEKQTTDRVILEGVTLSSRVLRVNLEPVHRVFVGLSTCGREMLKLVNAATDMLEKYWVDMMMEMALKAANRAMDEHISLIYDPGPLSSMCPGSIEDWPITEQKQLFNIIGKKASEIGVTLSESMLMEPVKSLSRIIFTSESRFNSCRLCPMNRCPSRKEPYDPDLMASGYLT
jgi:hypothetical protein